MTRRTHPTPFIIRPPAGFVAANPALGRDAADLARAYADPTVYVPEAALEARGRALWTALVAADPALPAAFEAARRAAGNRVLPLIVESDDPAVQSLPWEALCHPTRGFLGRDPTYALSRRAGGPPPDPAAADPGPLRVVMCTCLPDDLDPVYGRLNVEEQQALALQSLGPAISAGRARLEMPDDGRFATFARLVHDFEPQLVFLFTHGKFHDAPGQTAPPYADVLFEGEDGRAQTMTAEQLAQVLGGSAVQCLVLAACETGKSSSEALVAGLAGRLHDSGLAHVIGMRESIGETAAMSFNAAFGAAVAVGERVDVALQLARAAVAGLGERGLGQWPLPALLSHDPIAPLIDWNFTPTPPAPPRGSNLGQIALPARTVGRRGELRHWKGPLLRGERPVLLITGPGGQGKTALAGKIAADWEAGGGAAAYWRAGGGEVWESFWLRLAEQAGPGAAEAAAGAPDETARAAALLRLLTAAHGGRFLVYLDNLEALQDPTTLALTDARVAAFIAAARDLAERGAGSPDAGPRLLLTSRWRPPAWPAAAHLHLERSGYGDFLQMALVEGALRAFWGDDWPRRDDRPRAVYAALHGNGRGLKWFAQAIAGMPPAQEAAFLDQLGQKAADLQLDMALDALLAQLGDAERAFLDRLPAYDTPVPREGLIKLGLDLPDPGALLGRLLDRSLVEQYAEPEWQAVAYDVSPLVAGRLAARPGYALEPAWLRAAAEYQAWLYQYERPTLGQAMILHRALGRAGEREAADKLALRAILRPLDLAGLYRTLLKEWLPALRESADDKTRAAGLNWSGTSHHILGEYDRALLYHEQSLAILRAIGDRAGEGVTLNNISQIYRARGDYATALTFLEQSLAIQRAIGDRAGEGRTLNNISQIYQAHGDYATALTFLEQSLAIRREIGDRTGEGATFNNMATAAYARGDYATALTFLAQSLAIRREIGDRAGEGTTLNNISQIYHARGDYATALTYLEQSLTIQRAIGDRAGEGTTLNNISQIYDARGDYATALTYLEQSLAIRREIGDRAGEGATLNNMATAAYARSDTATALTYLEQSLAIQRAIGDRAGEGVTLNNISAIHWAQNDFKNALNFLEQSLAIQQAIGNAAGLCATLINIGHIHVQNEQMGEAVGAWLAAYQIASSIGYAQALASLESLAGQLGLPGGLAGWAALAQQMGEG